MSRDEWRITSAAIELEMERIAGLLQKSTHFHSRASAPQSSPQHSETERAPDLNPEPVHHR
jgi:hypothetical protein